LTHKGALRTRLALFLALTVLTGGLWPLFRPTPVHAAVSTNAAALLLTAAGNAGTITAAQGDVRLNLIDAATAAVTISGTWVATVQFEGTVDGTNWVAVNAYVPSTLAAVTSATANGTWIVPAAALGTIRVRSSAFTSGTIAVTIRNVGGSFFSPASAGTTTVTATQGTPAADGSANAWKVQGAVAQAGTITGVNPVAIGINDGSSVLRYAAGVNQVNATTGNGLLAMAPMAWDGTNFQKALQASAATGTAGTGLMGAGQLLFDLAGGTNYIRQAGDTSGRAMSVGAAADNAALAGNPLRIGISDGTNIQTPKQITSATGTTGTGLLGTGPALFDTVGGTNYVRQAGDGSGRAMVVGAAAAGAAVAGNPVLVGITDGTNAQTWKQGSASTATQGGTGYAGVVPLMEHAAGDFRSFTTAGFTSDGGSMSGLLGVQQYVYNGASTGVGADRVRNNLSAIIHASAVTGTGTVNTDVVNYNARFITVNADVTLYNAGNVTIKLQEQDANGIFTDIPTATTGAVSTGQGVRLTVGPNTWPANASPVFYANQHLPRLIRIVTTVAAASVTFSEAYELGGGF
jgi:hypothetical protein